MGQPRVIIIIIKNISGISFFCIFGGDTIIIIIIIIIILFFFFFFFNIIVIVRSKYSKVIDVIERNHIKVVVTATPRGPAQAEKVQCGVDGRAVTVLGGRGKLVATIVLLVFVKLEGHKVEFSDVTSRLLPTLVAPPRWLAEIDAGLLFHDFLERAERAVVAEGLLLEHELDLVKLSSCVLDCCRPRRNLFFFYLFFLFFFLCDGVIDFIKVLFFDVLLFCVTHFF